MQRSRMRTDANTASNFSKEDEESNEGKYSKDHGWFSWSDRLSIVVLLVLYTLQGIPMGLSGSIPMILKDKGVSYESLSLFSLVSLPFSMKIIWAPLVDSYYFPSIGRRKTWLIPVQLLTGLMMILGANQMQHWLREDVYSSRHQAHSGEEPDTWTLTMFFFVLYLLMATQDIAVDGWALTMLSRDNVGLASACNAFGQSLGVFIANQGLIALSDADWCVRYLGADAALVTLPSFMISWGWVFVVTTAVVCVFKKEGAVASPSSSFSAAEDASRSECVSTDGQSTSKHHDYHGNTTIGLSNGNIGSSGSGPNSQSSEYAFSKHCPEASCVARHDPIHLSVPTSSSVSEAELPGLRETVRQISLLCQLPSVWTFLAILFTARVGVAMVDGAFSFKLQEYGLRKTTLATMSPALLAVSFLTPVLAGHSVARVPLQWYYRGLSLRLGLSLLLWLLLQYTTSVYAPSASTAAVSDTPLYYATLLLLTCNEAASAVLFLAQMSFFNQISDPSIGGSYMTLLNTAANLGAKWSSVLSLYLLPKLTFAPCEANGGASDGGTSSLLGMCRSLHDLQCVERGGVCRMELDGYTVLTAIGFVLGALWLRRQQSTLWALQALPHSEWMVATAERLLSASSSSSSSSSPSSISISDFASTNCGAAAGATGTSSAPVPISTSGEGSELDHDKKRKAH